MTISGDGRLELDERRLRGECLCRLVGYSVADAFEWAANCHCSDCRRATGSAFKAFARIAREKLAITRGADNILEFGDGEGADLRCRNCGSLLLSVVGEGAFAHVAMGTLVDEPRVRPSVHIFVGSKAGWSTIADDLPQHEGHVVPSVRT